MTSTHPTGPHTHRHPHPHPHTHTHTHTHTHRPSFAVTATHCTVGRSNAAAAA